MVADDFVDDEVEELLGEGRIEIGLCGEFAESGDLTRLARCIGGRHVVLGFEASDPLGAFEPFRKHVNEGRIDVVDAGPDLFEFGDSFFGRAHSPDSTGRADSGAAGHAGTLVFRSGRSILQGLAALAQSVERLTRNEKVISSILIGGSIFPRVCLGG